MEGSVRDGVRLIQRLASLSAPAREDDFAGFVEEHYQRLVRLAALICNNAADAQDAVQNGLERAWRQRGQLRGQGSTRPWLDRIIVREAIRRSERSRLWIRRLEPRDDTGFDMADAETGPGYYGGTPRGIRVALDGAPGRHHIAPLCRLYGG